MPIRVACAAAIAFFAACSVVGIARAETPEERQACTDDAFQHCGDAIPDRDRVYHCLVRKVRLISPACRKVITRADTQTNSVRR
jgi:hypothetical protein